MFKTVCAYSFPEDAPHIDVTDSYLGNVTIYFPSNVDGLVTLNDLDFVNTSSQSYNGYFTYDGNDYIIQFQPYQKGRYRVNSSYDYRYLDITAISDPYGLISKKANRLSYNNTIIAVCVLLGVYSLWQLFQKR